MTEEQLKKIEKEYNKVEFEIWEQWKELEAGSKMKNT